MIAIFREKLKQHQTEYGTIYLPSILFRQHRSSNRSKHIDEVPWVEADTIVTLCGEDDEICPPVGAQVRRVHWALPDPSLRPEAEQMQGFRELRDEIRWRVASLWPRGD